MTSRTIVAVPLLAACVALAGCASSTTSGAPVGGSRSSGSDAPSSAQPTPTTSAALAARLQAAARTITSNHLTLSGGLAGTSVTGSGDATLSGGKVTALRLSEQLPGAGQLGFVLVGGETYLKVPALSSSADKPWHHVTGDSSNPVLARLASSLKAAASLSSVDKVALLTEAIASLKVLGSDTVDGAHTTHYALTLSVAKLPASLGLASTLAKVGVREVPLQLWMDDQGRPVKIVEALTISNHRITSTVTSSRFNQPVTITAPPASQIAAD